MKFKCGFDEMKNALLIIGRAVRKDRALEPGMQLVKLTANSDSETLTLSTSYQVGAEVAIPAKVEEAGEFVTEFTAVNVITVRDCEGNVTGSDSDSGKTLVLRYKGGNARTSLPAAGIPFTAVPQPDKSVAKVCLPFEKLTDLANGTTFVAEAATENMKFLKVSVSDDPDDDTLSKVSMSSCDGKSIAKVSVFCMNKGDFRGDVAFSPARMKLITDVLKGQEKETEVEISFSGKKVFVTVPGIRLYFPEIWEGNVPNLDQVLSHRKGTTFSAEIDRKEFIDALRSVIYLDPSGTVSLTFSDKDISVGCLGTTGYSEKLSVSSLSGNAPETVLFNAAMLKNIAERVPADILRIEGSNNRSPFFFPCEEGREHLYCALPKKPA